MQLSWLPAPKSQSVQAYRNIYTAKIQQNLFDDLLKDPSDEDDLGVLRAWENNTSDINHAEDKKTRVFQYGETQSTLGIFEKLNWRRSRFGEGITYGIWYGALEERTSIFESLHWSFEFARADLKHTDKPVIIERRMFKALCKRDKVVDLRKEAKNQPLLTDPTNYSLCQKLGKFAIQNRIGFYLTCSVRNPGGTCVPVFLPEVIHDERTMYYFKYTFFKDKDPLITLEQDEVVSGFLEARSAK
jgi:hypothetical protein